MFNCLLNNKLFCFSDKGHSLAYFAHSFIIELSPFYHGKHHFSDRLADSKPGCSAEKQKITVALKMNQQVQKCKFLKII